MANLIHGVENLFQDQKITPNTFAKFGCHSKRACRTAARAEGGGRPFVCGREPFVSLAYEKRALPRVLVLSLDWGGGEDSSPLCRKAKAVRRAELKCNPQDSGRTKHWRELHELALAVLRCFKRDLTLENVHDFYAYSNSAKCCANMPNGHQAPALMFANCRKYIRPEIELLAPDILITQGEHAEKAVQKSFEQDPETSRRLSKDNRWYSTVIEVVGRKVLWLRAPHPGARPQLSGSKLDQHYKQLAKSVVSFFPKAHMPGE